MTATVDDGAATGVSSVRFQVRPSATGIWIDVCTATTAPFTCSADTNIAPDGVYEARAIATDGAGFSTTSALSAGGSTTPRRRASMTDPGSPLSGTVNLNASAADPVPGSRRCGSSGPPQGRQLDGGLHRHDRALLLRVEHHGSLADGLYDLRAVATDVAGNATASAIVANRRVDNAGPTVVAERPGLASARLGGADCDRLRSGRRRRR